MSFYIIKLHPHVALPPPPSLIKRHTPIKRHPLSVSEAKMAKRTTTAVSARTASREMADPDEVRKVLEKLSGGTTFTKSCWQYRITPAQFWARVRASKELRREVAMACITQAWDRADAASAEDARSLPTFVRLARDMASSLDPEMWGERKPADVNVNVNIGVTEMSDDELMKIARMKVVDG